MHTWMCMCHLLFELKSVIIFEIPLYLRKGFVKMGLYPICKTINFDI